MDGRLPQSGLEAPEDGGDVLQLLLGQHGRVVGGGGAHLHLQVLLQCRCIYGMY